MDRGKIFQALVIVGSLTPCRALIAAEYPYIYRSAYFLGRGDTGIAEADAEEAIFYNPAGLAKGKGIYKQIVFAAPMIEASKDTRDVAKQIELQESDPTETLRKHEGIPQHVGANTFTGIILRRAAIGLFAHTSNTAMLYKDHKRGALESIYAESVTDTGAIFSLAHNFSKNFFVGLTAKYLKRNRAFFAANATESDKLTSFRSSDQISMLGTGTGADIGFLYKTTGRNIFSFGLTVQDLGNTTFIPDEKTDVSKKDRPLKDLKQTINIGVAYEPGTKYSKFRLLADLRDIANTNDHNPYKRLHLGTELTMRNVIGFTTGLNQGYPSFGLYFDFVFLRLDLGTYGEEVGSMPGSRPDIRYFAKIKVGL